LIIAEGAPTFAPPGLGANVGRVRLSLSYGFGLGTADNGNVLTIQNNRDAARTQTFTYDELNRIKTAEVPTAWGLSFGYDIWANLLSQTVTKGSAPMLSVVATTSNRIAGFCYDAAGNLLGEVNCSGYAYDAENRMSASAAGGLYVYDGDGKRVKKSSGTLYYYIPGTDNILQESDLAGNTLYRYVFFNGRRIVRRNSSSGEILYYFSDHLGSSNVVTNATGTTIKEESDFYPFGGERAITVGTNNYKFTGKERDSESGLDYFGARYYSSNLGRFITPDWDEHPEPVPYMHITDPQTLNLYAYVRNSPLSFVDPDGHMQCHPKAGDPRTIVCDPDPPKKKDPPPKAETPHQWPALMIPGVNYGRGNLAGGCPLSSCHTFNGLFPPLRPIVMVNMQDFAAFLMLPLSTMASLPASLTVEDVLANPTLLEGKSPAEVEAIIGDAPGLKVEQLGKGAHEGEGWALRQYDAQGKLTGRLIRWHPGGGHHGTTPYWRVSTPEGGKSGIIPGGK
jgi:RHS repeat-associated protein